MNKILLWGLGLIIYSWLLIAVGMLIIIIGMPINCLHTDLYSPAQISLGKIMLLSTLCMSIVLGCLIVKHSGVKND